jgi:hypothetical protein
MLWFMYILNYVSRLAHGGGACGGGDRRFRPCVVRDGRGNGGVVGKREALAPRARAPSLIDLGDFDRFIRPPSASRAFVLDVQQPVAATTTA